jgi:hypothetical protein
VEAETEETPHDLNRQANQIDQHRSSSDSSSVGLIDRSEETRDGLLEASTKGTPTIVELSQMYAGTSKDACEAPREKALADTSASSMNENVPVENLVEPSKSMDVTRDSLVERDNENDKATEDVGAFDVEVGGSPAPFSSQEPEPCNDKRAPVAAEFSSAMMSRDDQATASRLSSVPDIDSEMTDVLPAPEDSVDVVMADVATTATVEHKPSLHLIAADHDDKSSALTQQQPATRNDQQDSFEPSLRGKVSPTKRSIDLLPPSSLPQGHAISECDETSSLSEEDMIARPVPAFRLGASFQTSVASEPATKKLSLRGIKTSLFSIGCEIHGRFGYERVFSQYWSSFSIVLHYSGSRDSTMPKHRAIIASFLKTRKLRKLHNKLVLGKFVC